MDGIPFRKIADQLQRSVTSVARQYKEELKDIPHNNTLTQKYCNRFCGIIVVDGKYIRVKGYEKKIPLLWGIDYLTHDIPVYFLAPSESYQAWLRYFGYLKSIKYSLKLVVCDDNTNIKLAARYIFPHVLIQTCQNHFLENIRRDLKVRTEGTYQGFVQDLKAELFSKKINREDFNVKAYRLYRKYQQNPVACTYLIKIHEATNELTAYSQVKHAPKTTNINESFNSHIQARLKAIKSFQSYKSADKWINAYIIKRRFRIFRDCSKSFRYLNGKTSISFTLKKSLTLPLLSI